MPKLLFTDEQKTALAKEAGITGKPDTNTFDKEYDPSSGDYKMYMKLGNGSKFFGEKPTTAKADDGLVQQAAYFEQQFGGKTMQDMYQAMMNTQPKDKVSIRDQIGMGPGGIYSQQEGITQQIANLQKMRAGNQAEIFSAVGPDGRPIDPRIAVAQYQGKMKAIDQNETVLRGLQDVYNAQLETLTNAEYSRQEAENKKTQTALSFLKDQEDRKLQEQKLAEDKRQFDVTAGLNKDKVDEDKRQYNLTNGISDPTQNIPVAVDDISKYVAKSRGTDLVQCGMVSNDYWKMKTGSSLGMGDTFDSKIKAIEKVGKSDIPVEGGIFAFPIKTFAGDSGHTGVVKTRNEDGSIEVLEANREGSAKGGKMVTHTYSAEQVKKMTFSVAPTGGSTQTTEKKPATFNAFIEKLDIPDGEYSKEDIDGLIDAAAQDYPTEKRENVANAIRNRAGPQLKKAMDDYGSELSSNDTMNTWKEKLIGQIGDDKFSKQKTKATISMIESDVKDPKKVVEVLKNAGFFDTYKKSWYGDDDQYDALEEWADKNGVDLEDLKTQLNI